MCQNHHTSPIDPHQLADEGHAVKDRALQLNSRPPFYSIEFRHERVPSAHHIGKSTRFIGHACLGPSMTSSVIVTS